LKAFPQGCENLKEQLMAIESFICGGTENKRSTLHHLQVFNPLLKEKLGYLCHIRHEGIYDFQLQLASLIDNN